MSADYTQSAKTKDVIVMSKLPNDVMIVKSQVHMSHEELREIHKMLVDMKVHGVVVLPKEVKVVTLYDRDTNDF